MEEADYRSTTELFAKKGDEKTLDNFIPKSESDFLEYAELLSHKLRSYEVCKLGFPLHLFVIVTLFCGWLICNWGSLDFHSTPFG